MQIIVKSYRSFIKSDVVRLLGFLLLLAVIARVQQLEQHNKLLLDYYKATNEMLDSIDKDYPLGDTYFETDGATKWIDLNNKIGRISLKERGYVDFY